MARHTMRTIDRASVRGYSVVPLLTPFRGDGSLDEPAVTRLVGHVLDGGCQGLLVAGTTGEAASMTATARARLIALAAAQARGRGMLFAGVGDNCLEQAVAHARTAFRAGADAAVAHLPSYFPIGPAEMENWFLALASRVEGPLFIYNIPQTTRHSIPLEVLERLSRHPRIAGLKDSEPDAARHAELGRLFSGRADFIYFCGTVPMAIPAMRAGAEGFVPSAGNLVPAATRELMDRCIAGDGPGAEAAQARVNAISQVYQKGRGISGSLSAMKAAVSLLGLCQPHMLPPLLPLDETERGQVREAMREVGVLP